MRLLIAFLVIVYLVGVGVELSPTVRDKWNTAPASELVASIGQALPAAGRAARPPPGSRRTPGAAPRDAQLAAT